MSGSIAVLGKAFRVLEAMTDAGCALTLKQLGEISGLPKPTLHRILQTLSELGYVEQDRARSRYSLTLQLLRLGHGDAYDEIKERALPLMESLHRCFDETVNLAVLQGTFIQYVHFIETTQNLRWQVKPGARDPFYCTALGRAIVGFLPKVQQDRLIERVEIVRRTPFTPPDATTIRARLAASTRNGWARDDQENDVGVCCFGIPLLQGDMPVAALSVSIPKSRLTRQREREIIDALMTARGEFEGLGAQWEPARLAGR